MPIYDRHCQGCDELFEVNCRISDKDKDHECPFCESFNGAWRPSMPYTANRSERFMTTKKDGGFTEVLQKIQERNKRTSICER